MVIMRFFFFPNGNGNIHNQLQLQQQHKERGRKSPGEQTITIVRANFRVSDLCASTVKAGAIV